MRKEIIQKAYQMGYEAFPRLPSPPFLNVEFMKILPKCHFSDMKGCKLRATMYKEYIKGWVRAHLDLISK